MTRRQRDVQRSRVYAWERRVNPAIFSGVFDLDETEAFVKRVWRAGRGRYGMATQEGPAVLAKHHGRATGSRGALQFPRWSRNT